MVGARTGPVNLLGGTVATLGSTMAFLRCALSNPGILRPRRGTVEDSSRFPPGASICRKCQISQPVGTKHCDFCQVCVDHLDHHCPWMSKCIGSGNISYFYNFLCVSLTSLVYVAVATMVNCGGASDVC